MTVLSPCWTLQDIVDQGLISSAQLEAVLYANMCFKVFLEGPGVSISFLAPQHPTCTLLLTMLNTCSVWACA